MTSNMPVPEACEQGMHFCCSPCTHFFSVKGVCLASVPQPSVLYFAPGRSLPTDLLELLLLRRTLAMIYLWRLICNYQLSNIMSLTLP